MLRAVKSPVLFAAVNNKVRINTLSLDGEKYHDREA